MITDTYSVIRQAKVLLLDFDGPICSIFSQIPAYTVADKMRNFVQSNFFRVLPEENDPFKILAYSTNISDKCEYAVNALLTSEEVEAALTARPTEATVELIKMWRSSNRECAIVSNNSTLAIKTYLSLHKISHWINWISGRSWHNIKLLKPDPYLIVNSARHFKVKTSDCLMVGDSYTDMQAATAANTPSIGLSNKPGKSAEQISAGATCTVDNMSELIELIGATSA